MSSTALWIRLRIQLDTYIYQLTRCCKDSAHLTNFDNKDYDGNMSDSLFEIRSWLTDMLAMRQMDNVTVYNPCEALGMTGAAIDTEYVLELWGADPVHPTQKAYELLAEHIQNHCGALLAARRLKKEEEAKAAGAAKGPSRPQKAVRRESWVAGSEPVAKRQMLTTFGDYRRGGNPRGGGGYARGSGPQGPFKRGFRGRGGRGGGQECLTVRRYPYPLQAVTGQ